MKKFSNYFEKEILVGGQGDNKPDSDFDADELKMGIEHEMKEHGMTEEMATETAKDHLVENPKYYSELKKFEKQQETNEEIGGAVSSSDFHGVNLPLVGIIRRPYVNAIGDFTKPTVKNKKKPKMKMKKFSQRFEEMEGYGGFVASIGPTGQASIQKTFGQPLMVSVDAMTKTSFKDSKKNKKMIIKKKS